METIQLIIVGVIAFIAGSSAGYFIWSKALEKRSKKIITEAEAEGEVIKKDKI